MAAPVKDKFDAIIIDPDLESRMRLKQATASVHNFGKVYQIGTFRDCLAKLNGSDPIDVVFISYKVPEEEVGPFIKSGKETPQGQDTAYVLVLPPRDQDSSTVAQNVLIGADGFLFEPYSVDGLVEITRISARVKGERSEAREKAAVNFVVNDVINQIDHMAYEKTIGRDVGMGIRKLRDTTNVLRTFSEKSMNQYYELIIESMMNAPVPKKIFAKYVGVSSRVKARMDARKVKEAALQGETTEAETPGTTTPEG